MGFTRKAEEKDMNKPYKLKSHLCRSCRFFALDDPAVPAELLTAVSAAPDLSNFAYPLPSKKSDYTCFAVQKGVVWYGAKTGLTRFDPAAEREEDIIMYFSADRDLRDNNVKALLAKDNGIWALTDTGATFITMQPMSAEEKAYILLQETLDHVERRGMISQKELKTAYDFSSKFSYAHSDNDGGFSAACAMGEIFRYETLRREKGADHPETLGAKAIATKIVEACLLLMYIHGRGDGFVARSYGLSDEPVPDDGFFFRRNGNKAKCEETSASKKAGFAGLEIDCSAPIPERLSKLYKDLGYTDDDVYYKADTSSDEITLHYLMMYFAHKYLTWDDPELEAIIKDATTNITNHIVDNNYELRDFTGKATTWAKWNPAYFSTVDGYVDGCLNSAELLSYLLTAMEITGEKGKWKEHYDRLINDLGYADLVEGHYDRLYQFCIATDSSMPSEIMFGDHMLATSSFWLLCTLEKDEKLLAKYRKGFTAWRTSIADEHNPGYDIPYILSCPDEKIDIERLATWFYRTNSSRLAAGVSLIGRHDVAPKALIDGYTRTSYLLPPDERFISKYDRDPLRYKNEDSGGSRFIESCYVYTFAYWLGRLNGLFE